MNCPPQLIKNRGKSTIVDNGLWGEVERDFEALDDEISTVDDNYQMRLAGGESTCRIRRKDRNQDSKNHFNINKYYF